MTNISISAILNTYNRSSVLSRAHDSILNQSSPVQEIIIIDDGSTDDTEDVAMSLANRSTIPTRYIKKTNSGLPASRNTGARIAKCELLAYLDDDDIWVSDHIERLRELVEQFPNAVLYGGRTKRADINETELDPLPQKVMSEYISVPGRPGVLVRARANFVAPYFVPALSTTLISKHAAVASPFDELLRLRGDILFVWRIGEQGKVVLDDRLHALIDQLDTSLASAGNNTSDHDKKLIDLKRAYYTRELAQRAINSRSRAECPILYKMAADSEFGYAYALVRMGRSREAWMPLFKSMKNEYHIKHLRLGLRILLSTLKLMP